MISFRRICLALTLTSAVLALPALGADPAPGITARDLAAKLSTVRQDGSSYVRLRMEISGATKETLQLQIKQRRSKESSDVVYQVLFPKERKGESVLLRKSGNRAATGSVFIPPNKLQSIDDMKGSLFGSDLSYEDIVDDFFSWDQQSFAGTEIVDGVSCQVLESKPGKGERSTYGSVKSWIDLRRNVPMRVEKYSGAGKLVRRIDTTRVVTDAGHALPANLNVQGPGGGSSTQLDGSKISHDVSYADKDFTADALKELTGAKE